jgi:hypothetical protein
MWKLCDLMVAGRFHADRDERVSVVSSGETVVTLGHIAGRTARVGR